MFTSKPHPQVPNSHTFWTSQPGCVKKKQKKKKSMVDDHRKSSDYKIRHNLQKLSETTLEIIKQFSQGCNPAEAN